MAFSWRRLRRLSRLNRPRDLREDLVTLGRYAPAPARQTAPIRIFPHDWTNLWGATALGYTRIVRRFLAQGAAVNARDAAGRTALAYAVDERRRDLVELLLAHGADPDLRDEKGHGSLHLAVLRQDAELTTLLLRAHADPEGGSNDTPTPLMEAVRGGDAALADLLLAAGASPRTRDRWGQTALFYLRGATADATLPLLLEAGARVSERADDGDTPLHRALRQGDARLYRALVPADDEARLLALRGRADDTLLHAAAEGSNPALVQRLLALGSEPNARNVFGHTPLLVALSEESLPVATVLTRAGATVGFLEAIALGDVAQAEVLAPPVGVLLDAPVAGQETPLLGAIARGRADLAALLLAHGANPDAPSPALGVPLDLAILTEQPALARLLLDHGARVHHLRHATLDQLRTLLDEDEETLPRAARLEAERATPADIYAAAVESDAALQFLLLCGANLDQRTEEGETALMQAARDGDLPAVERLLAFGASPKGARTAARSRTEILALLPPDA